MKKVPRASLAITLLDDEDYRRLVGLDGGLEAFGAFVALVLAGRERLQQGKAARLGDTDALVFLNGTEHVLSRAGVTPGQLRNCLDRLAEVAAGSDSCPWLYVDPVEGRLVIRSFYKYNTNENWGGSRPGAGRPKIQDGFKKIQDDSRNNHLETDLNPSRFPSGTVSGSGTVPSSLSASPAGRQAGDFKEEGKEEGEDIGSHQEAVELALDLFGAAAAQVVSSRRMQIEHDLEGIDGRPRWDCYMAALRHADRYRKRPGNAPILDLNAFCLNRAKEWVVTGIPAGPLQVEAAPHVPYSQRSVPGAAPSPQPVRADETQRRRYALPAREQEPENSGGRYNGFRGTKGGGH